MTQANRPEQTAPPAAVLVSGGIDSSVLAVHMCRSHERVYPVFVRAGLLWEAAELEHLERFLRDTAMRNMQPLKLVDLPIRDIYGEHWSTTGRDTPDAASDDSEVYLPGRNIFLISKAAVWCSLERIPILAIAPLKSNPFPDSTSAFYRDLERLLVTALGAGPAIRRPFADCTKQDVIRLGAEMPLEHTFSCIHPLAGRHCGRCNKCGERQRGFAAAGVPDPTPYAQTPAPARR